MNWHRRDHYYIETGCSRPVIEGKRCNGYHCGNPLCGRYTVCRAWVNGRWIYSAYHRAGFPATHLHTSVDKNACVQACEEHAGCRTEQAA